MLDYVGISQSFSDEARQVQAAARRFLDAKALPHVASWWEEGVFPRELIAAFGEMGFYGSNLPERYGTAGVDNTAYGLIMYELERIDSGLRSFASVQGALVMYPIHAFGSEQQKQDLLPRLATGELVGCFGLTEHDGGSDPGAMRTRARRDGDDYVLSGTKMWITNGNVADVAIVWAADEDGEVLGFVVPCDAPGFAANEVHHKMSLRASVTSELVLDGVRVPASSRLPEARGLRAPLSCLTQARYGIAWGVLGALEALYEEARAYAATRTTFGRPIAARQLVQEKLVEMIEDHTKGLLLMARLAELKDAGELSYAHVSLAKRGNVRSALRAARAARDLLGGSGITLEYHAIRHMLNLETVSTYEGTHDIHTLIVGRHLTGENALG